MDPTTLSAVMKALGWGAYVPVALAVAGLAAHVAAVLPQTTSTAPVWLRVLRGSLDVLGGNYGSAANAAAPKS